MTKIRHFARGAAAVFFLAVFWGVSPLFLRAEETQKDDTVQVKQVENRTQAIIHSPAEGSAQDRPNIIYRSAGAVAHGLYFSTKAVVDAIGKGMDSTVRAVQTGGRKTYDFLTPKWAKKKA